MSARKLLNCFCLLIYIADCELTFYCGWDCFWLYSQTASNHRTINWYWLTQFQQRRLHQCATGFGTVADLRIHSCQNSFCFTGCQPSAARLSLPKGGGRGGRSACKPPIIPRYRIAQLVLHRRPPPGQGQCQLG